MISSYRKYSKNDLLNPDKFERVTEIRKSD